MHPKIFYCLFYYINLPERVHGIMCIKDSCIMIKCQSLHILNMSTLFYKITSFLSGTDPSKFKTEQGLSLHLTITPLQKHRWQIVKNRKSYIFQKYFSFSLIFSNTRAILHKNTSRLRNFLNACKTLATINYTGLCCV